MSRHVAPAAVLIGVLLSWTASISAQTRYTLRAPIDGTIRTIAQEGSQLRGGVSPSQAKYDAIRSGLGLPRIHLSSERSLSPDSVALITSDVLELQLIQETTRLRAAMDRFVLADSALALERRLRFTEEGLRVQQNQVDILYMEEDLARNPRAPNWRERLQLHGYGLSRDKVEVFRARQAQALDQELPKSLNIARAELNAAESSVKIIEATAALGHVVCPKACTVREVLVLPGQHVTKGDPIVVVEVLRENR